MQSDTSVFTQRCSLIPVYLLSDAVRYQCIYSAMQSDTSVFTHRCSPIPVYLLSDAVWYQCIYSAMQSDTSVFTQRCSLIPVFLLSDAVRYQWTAGNMTSRQTNETITDVPKGHPLSNTIFKCPQHNAYAPENYHVYSLYYDQIQVVSIDLLTTIHFWTLVCSSKINIRENKKYDFSLHLDCTFLTLIHIIIIIIIIYEFETIILWPPVWKPL